MGSFIDTLGLTPNAAPAPDQGAVPTNAAPVPQDAVSPVQQQDPATPIDDRSFLGRVADGAWSAVKDVGQGVIEAVPAALRGASKAVQELDRAAFDAGNWLNENVADLGRIEITKNGVKWVRDGKSNSWENEAAIAKPLEAVTPAAAKSVTGGMVEGVSQFLTSYVIGGRLLGAVGGTFAETGNVARLANSTTKSLFAGAAGFDPAEAGMANLLNGVLGDPITEYLSHKEGDSRAEGRLKNALENAGMNLPVDALFLAIKGIRAARAGNLKESQALSDQVAHELESWQTRGTAAEPAAAPKADASVPGGTAEPKAPTGPAFDGASADGSKVAKQARTVVLEPPTPLDPPTHVSNTDGAIEPFRPTFEWGKDAGEELLSRFGEAIRNPGRMTSDIRDYIYKNLSRVRTADEGKWLANEMGRMAAEDFDRAMGPSVTLQQIETEATAAAKAVAEYTGTDWRQMIMMAGADRADMRKIMQRTIGYRVMTEQASQRTGYLASLINKGDLTKWAGNREAAIDEFVQALTLQHAIAPTTEGIKSEFGRGLSVLRADVGPSSGKAKLPKEGLVQPVEAASAEAKAASAAASPAAQVEKAVADKAKQQVIAALGGDEAAMDKLIARLAIAGDNTKASGMIIRNAFNKGFMDVHNELLINALLSSPKTSIVNMATGLLKTAVVMPTERLIAGMLKGDPAMMREAADQYVGMFLSLKDSWRMAKEAMMKGEALVDPTHQGMGARVDQHAITASTFGLNTDSPLGAFVEGMGGLIRLPARLLTTQDELLKQINYRSRLYALGMRGVRGMEDAHGTPKKGLAEYYAEFVDRGLDSNGAATNAEALAYARDATFTNDLKVITNTGGRSFGETMSQLANSHPAMRAVMPFVRVPTNIMRDLVDHTPGMNYLRAQVRADLQAGGERAAMARAKMATGGAMWTTAIWMAMNGDIVGNMPSDPKIARTWKEAGIEPNSIRYTKEDGTYGYLNISRFDPYASFFSLAGTFADLTRNTETWRTEDIAHGMVVSLAKNLESKTYLTGLVELLGVIGDPDKNVERFLQKRAAAYIPQITANFAGKDYLSDPHSIAQAMWAKQGADGVDRKFNVVGEPVRSPKAWGPDWLSPIALGNENDPTLSEIARLATVHKGVLGYPAKKVGGVDMTQIQVGDQTAYARAQELAGQITVGGKTMRDRLTDLFNSDAYVNRMTDGEPGTKGSRVDQAAAIIQHYREAGRLHLMKESPEYRAAYIEAQTHAADVMRRGATNQ